MGIMQILRLAGRPLLEQYCSRIFTTKDGAQGSLEGASEEHRRTGVLLLPAVEIAMPVSSWASQILADLGVAVGHQATCGLSRFAGQSSSHRSAGAKPSSRSREVPLKMMWLILTTPFSPTS